MLKSQSLTLHSVERVSSLRHSVSGSGPWVVLIHSLATHGGAWDNHAAWLCKEHTVLQYDVSGHGASPLSCITPSLDSFALELDELLQMLRVNKAHIVGVSMGGMVAQHYAIKYTQRVRSLILVATTGMNTPADRSAWMTRIATAQNSGMNALVDEFLNRWFTKNFLASKNPILEDVTNWIANTRVDGFIAAVNAISELDTLGSLRKLTIPSLVIAGENDLATPPAVVKSVADAIDGSKYVVIPKAAHWVPLEQPERFKYELEKFLAAN
jgi:3-oxoadipate enol-lactonase